MELLLPHFFVFINSNVVTIILLILSGVFEKQFIGRGLIIGNIVLLWQIVIPLTNVDSGVIFYVNISILFLVIALYSNLSRVIPQIDYKKLHPIFYQLSYALYSSKTIIGFVISSILRTGFGGALIITIIVWFISIKYLGHKLPFRNQ